MQLLLYILYSTHVWKRKATNFDKWAFIFQKTLYGKMHINLKKKKKKMLDARLDTVLSIV